MMLVFPVSKIGCCGGAGGDDLPRHMKRDATHILLRMSSMIDFWKQRNCINLIDGDHYCTENVVVPYLERMLLDGFPDL
jgi:hypothetical protein